MGGLTPWSKNLIANPITIHFIHRGLAYIVLASITLWWFASRNIQYNKLFSSLRTALLVLVWMQVILGILTLLNATYTNRLVVLGVSHQFTGMSLLMCMVAMLFIVKKKSTEPTLATTEINKAYVSI